MNIQINDQVIATTRLTRCKLLGIVTAIDGNKYTIRLPFPIRGEEYAIVSRENLLLVKKEKPIKTVNTPMKQASQSIVKRLESIATMNENRPPKQQRRDEKPSSNNWLDYMKDNDIE